VRTDTLRLRPTAPLTAAGAAAESDNFELGVNAFTYTIIIGDAEGNSSTGSVTLNVGDVDEVPPVNPTIDTIEGDNIINAAEDDDVLVSGTAEANSTVDITITDGTNTVTRQVTANGAGVWTIVGAEADLSGFNEGAVTVSATATDAASNVSGVTVTTPTHDSVAPILTIATNAGIDNILNSTEDDDVIVSGTGADAGATVAVTLTDGTLTTVVNVTADGAGNWTLLTGDADLSTFAEGTNNIAISASSADSAGNVGTVNTTVSHDTTAPTLTIVTTAGIDNILNSTEDDDVIVSGTGADAGATVAVTLTDGTLTTVVNVVADGAGNWTLLTGDADLSTFAEGTNNIAISASSADMAGNVGTVNTTVSHDTTAPTVGTATQTTADSTPAISGTIDDTTATLQVTVNGNTYPATNNGGGTWTLVDNTISPALGDGTYDVTVVATDTAGNVTTSTTVGALVINAATPDTTPPANPVINAIEVDNIINGVEDDDVLVSGTAEANSTVDITITDGTTTVTRQVTTNGAGVWTIAGNEADLSGFDEGAITVTATATDAANNTSGVTVATVNHDSIGPGITLTTPIEGDNIINAAEQADVLAQGTTEAGATVVVTFTDGVSTVTSASIIADGAGNWTLTGNEVDLNSLADGAGNITVTATATDAAGNESDVSNSLSKDVIAPLASVSLDTISNADANAIAIAAFNGNTVSVSGTVGGDVKDGDTVTIDINGNIYTSLVAGGTFTITGVDATDFLNDADSKIDAIVATTDDAGNTSNAAGDISFSVDPVNKVQFTDNFANGVTYTTSSGLTGLTGDAGDPGSFYYRAGDTITLTIGDVKIAEFSATAINGSYLFLQDVAGTSLSDVNLNYVENMAIFLQALDSDHIDSTPGDGVLQTNDLQNTVTSYNNNIVITQAIRDAFTGYIDPTTGAALDISVAGKQQISNALASVNIEFTRDTERDASGNNVFETIAIDHVADTIDSLAGARHPGAFDARTVDVLNVPGAPIKYDFTNVDATGEITFSTNDLLVGAVGKQVITENLLVSNVKLAAGYTDIGVLENRGGGNYAIVLNPGFDQYDLEGLSIDYRVEDWTVFTDVTSSAEDQNKSHLSANIPDVNEGDGFNQFTLNSELTFGTDSNLIMNFTSEGLSTSLGYPVAEYADDYLVPVQYSNDGGATWDTMTQSGIVYNSLGVPRPVFGFVLEAGNDAVEIRIPIFDDVKIEDPIEYFDAVVTGDNVYDEHLKFGIIDNDVTPSVLPEVSVNFVYATEDQGNALYTVTLNQPSANTITVDYNMVGIGAIAGVDFVDVTGTVTFAAGTTTATIAVPIIDDAIQESPNPELAVINLTNPTNAVLADSQGTLRIFDNDFSFTAPISVDIDPITPDSIINASEAGTTISVTGVVDKLGAPIDTAVVAIKVNGINYITSMLSDGSFAVKVPGSELVIDGDATVEALVLGFSTDGLTSGTAAATEVYSVDVTAPTAPSVLITEDFNNDGTVDDAELVGNVNVSIGLPIDAVAGDTLTVTDGLSTQTITLTASQITAGTVATNFTPPATGSTISVTARITDTAGNVSTSNSVSALVISTPAPPPPPPPPPPTTTPDEVIPDEIFNPVETPKSPAPENTEQSVETEFTADGAVIDAVSGAHSLGSVGSLGSDGAVLDAVEGANSSTIYFGDSFDGKLASNTGLWDVSGVKGFSVSFSVSESSQGSGSESGLSLFPLRVGVPESESKDQLIVKSILRDRSLFLEVDYTINSDPNLLATSISVLQVNGSPLPEWLRVDDNGGLVSGEPPVGTDMIELRIEVTLSDGTVVVRYLDVNVTSGEIAALQKIGDEFIAGASLFDEQIAQESVKFDDSIERIKNIFIN